MTELLTGVVGGFLGSAHCVGMCGGIAAALGASNIPLWPIFSRQLAYNFGRVFTYMVLGAVGGSAGLVLAQYKFPLVTAQQVFSVIAGAVMLLVGLSVLGAFRIKWTRHLGIDRILAPMFRQCMNARSIPGFFAVGIANGFLPCGLVYAFLALALSSGDMWRGMVLMLGFGLGTVPAMLSIGCGARLVSHGFRQGVMRLAACFVVLLGVTAIYRAFPGHGEDCCSQPPVTWTAKE